MYRLRIKEVLKEKGVSQGKLSRGADLALNTVRKLIKDPNYIPNVYTLRKIADYLGVSMDELYCDDGESPRSE